MPHSRRIALLVLSLSVAFIAVMTLFPAGDHISGKVMSCIICGGLGGTDAFLNVLLFVPFGIGLGLMRVRPLRGVLAAFALTATIEFLQYKFIPGRDASLGDVITNTLGGALGQGLVRWSATWLWTSPRAARRMTLAWGGVYLAIQWVGAWGSGPAFPPGPFWAQLQPRFPGTGIFGGTLIAARLRDLRLPGGRIPDSVEIRPDRRREPSVLTALVIAGRPTSGLAPIARVVNASGSEALLLAQRNTSLVFGFRMRAAVARVRLPFFALGDAFPSSQSNSTRSPADSLWLSAVALHDRVHLVAESRYRRVQRDIALSPSMTWMFAMPFAYAMGASARPLTAIWLAALLCPFGYWSWRSRSPRHFARPRTKWGLALPIGLGLIVEVLGLATLPLLFGLEISHWSEWMGASFGLAAGWLLAIAVARLSTNDAGRPTARPGAARKLTESAVPDAGATGSKAQRRSRRRSLAGGS